MRWLLTACFAFVSTGAAAGEISATATYLERIRTPPDAVLELRLLEEADAGAAQEIVAVERLRIDGVPAAAVLTYDDDRIASERRYLVVGRLESRGRVIFRTLEDYPVLTEDAGSTVELLLRRVDTDKEKGLPGPLWAVAEIEGTAVGADDPPTIRFDEDGKFALYGGCNRFVGTANVSPGGLTLPPAFPGSLMACPPARMTLEHAALSALRKVRGWVRSHEELILTDDTGAARLRLTATGE